ncbi:MAG: hypothetical protein LIO81_07885 [Clostridiales bacterium]|nr:hypothetical protein [Clostridiales bacterium]
MFKQIISCNTKIFATYKAENGDEIKERVICLALTDEGEITPLIFDKVTGVDIYSIPHESPSFTGYELAE